MGLAERHAYRSGYLKSEQWSCVRAAALAKAQGKCAVCQFTSHANDAHHIWYPPNVYDTTEDHLAVLCRGCHDFVHTILPESVTSSEHFGRAKWGQFLGAIITWRLSNEKLFSTLDGLGDRRMKQLFAFKNRLERSINRDDSGDVDGFEIHIPKRKPNKKGAVYRCHTFFKLPHRVTWIIGDLNGHLSIPNFPVKCIHGKRVTSFSIATMAKERNISMTTAGVLAPMEFHLHDWDSLDIQNSRAISAYIAQLPDHWPCFIKTPKPQ